MELPSSAVGLSHHQHGVATRLQLVGSGLTRAEVEAQVEGGRWTPWGRHVVVLHNFVPSRRQLMWAAVLDAGEEAAMASHSSLELAGFRAFAAEAEAVHLIVSRGAKVHADPRVFVHESRRVHPEWHVVDCGVPRTQTARSVLDAGAWQRWPRFACAMVAAAVQQRVCTPDELDTALRVVGRIRHKNFMREALRDVRGGSEALSELDLMRVCRHYGLRPPTRQVRRRGLHGWRYLDATWELPDARTVVLEVDGAHHLDVEHWQADIQREREVVLTGALVLRATSIELRVDPGPVARDLMRAGVPTCQT